MGGFVVIVVIVMVVYFVVLHRSSRRATTDPLIDVQDSLGEVPRGAPAYIADIEFSYHDARGNASHRRVEVEAVDREYFQGHCHKAGAERTFVIGRVRGKVLDLDSGELLTPKTWAEEARNHPLNDPQRIVIGRDDAVYEDDADLAGFNSDAAIEICFTGFSKADKLRLEAMAYSGDMTVRQSVTVGLTHLCTGPNAGPKKIEKAIDGGAKIIDEAEFYSLYANT